MPDEMISAALGVLRGYLIPFALFTGIGLVLAGRGAFKWSSQLLGSVRANIFLRLANPFLAVIVGVCVIAVDRLYSLLPIPMAPNSFWQAQPVWLVIIVWTVAIDFCDYWNHRLLHTRGFWDIHAVHHSDEAMNWTTSSRIHVLETVVMMSSYIILASWMNIPAEGVGAVSSARLLHNNWVHTRYDFHLGPLTKVIATPRFHHWHHADEPAAYNTNFGNTFSFWDVMFGTYRVPSAYTGKFGFDGTPGNNISKLLIWPYLQWLRAFQGLEHKKNKTLTP
ncbi:MAG: sterol desaturase family protein [Pseudomonadota bacterium]